MDNVMYFKENFKLGKWLVARSFANMGAVSTYPFLLAYFGRSGGMGD